MVKLYYATGEQLREEAVFSRLLEEVATVRKEKVWRCKKEGDRRRSLMAGLLLKQALTDWGYTYEELEFAEGEFGKPYVCNHPEVFFSISHAGEYAVCAVSDALVGVDIEGGERALLSEAGSKNRFLVAKRSFHPTELKVYEEEADAGRQRELFLKYWTRKEAQAKAVGRGLAMDFRRMYSLEEKLTSFWLTEDYYVSVYREDGQEEIVLCMMN